MNLRTNFFEYSVNEIAVSSDNGNEMSIARKVTVNVPVMNGRNPNFFWDGFHSEDDTRSQNEFSWRIGIDFIVSPAIIAMSSSTEDIVSMNMKTEERFCL